MPTVRRRGGVDPRRCVDGGAADIQRDGAASASASGEVAGSQLDWARKRGVREGLEASGGIYQDHDTWRQGSSARRPVSDTWSGSAFFFLVAGEADL